MRIILLLVFLCILVFESPGYCLNGETHKIINENIAQRNANSFSLNEYLRDILGFKKGVEEDIKSLKVWRWIGEGGKREDEPYWVISSVSPIRTVNHFHNPLTDQGLTGGESAVAWSQEDLGAQSQGNYAWRDVRKYFNDALTTKDTDDREENLAEMFRGLGQLMHLVQDMSVPEHARNDVHVWPSGYETWAIGSTNGNQHITFDDDSSHFNIINHHNLSLIEFERRLL